MTCNDYADVIKDSDYCYKVHRSQKSWHNAMKHCQSENGYLVHIKSEEENKKIFDYAQRSGDPRQGILWTGLKKERGTWTWAPQGEPVNYTAWRPRGPSKYSCGNQQQNSYDIGKWGSWICSTTWPFMCMRPKGKVSISIMGFDL